MQSNRLLADSEMKELAASHGPLRCVPRSRQDSKDRVVTIKSIMNTAHSGGGGAFQDQDICVIHGQTPHALSWVAQEALDEARKSEPTDRLITALDRNRALRVMLASSGWRAVYGLLKSSGMGMPRLDTMRILAAVLLIASVVATGAFVWLAAQAQSALTPVPVIVGGTALLCFCVWAVAVYRVRAIALEHISSLLAASSVGEGLSAEVGRILGPDLIRHVHFTTIIVDNYSQLPTAVRSGIAEAWRKGKLDHAVNWVVSDSAASSLCLDALTKLRDGGVQGLAVRAYDMQPVPGKERLETAGAIRAPSS